MCVPPSIYELGLPISAEHRDQYGLQDQPGASGGSDVEMVLTGPNLTWLECQGLRTEEGSFRLGASDLFRGAAVEPAT